jgi:hypothetical protein
MKTEEEKVSQLLLPTRPLGVIAHNTTTRIFSAISTHAHIIFFKLYIILY